MTGKHCPHAKSDMTPCYNQRGQTAQRRAKLIRVTAPHFVAGAIARDGRIEECAPILRRHVMWLTGDAFAAVCKGNGWTWEIVDATR